MKLKIVCIQRRKLQGWNNKESLKHIYKSIFINLFAFEWWTNNTFQNVSLKGLKRKQNVLKLQTTPVFSYFFVEGNDISTQQCLNIHFKSKT